MDSEFSLKNIFKKQVLFALYYSIYILSTSQIIYCKIFGLIAKIIKTITNIIITL